MTDCPRADVRDLLPDWMHGSLAAPQRAAVEAHLRGCEACRAEAALLGAVRGALDAAAPRVDVARIAAAARGATRPARRARRPWRSGVGVLALAASLVGVAVLSRDADERPLAAAGARGRVASPPGAPRADSSARGAATPPLVAAPAADTPTAARTIRPGAELSIGGGVADLDEVELEALLRRLEGVEALPEEAPAPLLTTLSEEEG